MSFVLKSANMYNVVTCSANSRQADGQTNCMHKHCSTILENVQKKQHRNYNFLNIFTHSGKLKLKR